MKLDEWKMQSHILEINEVLPPDLKWPLLEQLLAELGSVPRVSCSNYDVGIFIGWAKKGSWVYHHAVCLASSHPQGNRYGYHSGASFDTMATALDIYPVFNVGHLPETQDFISALASIGILADQFSPALSPAQLGMARSS